MFGCAFNRVNLVNEGVVTLERVDPENNCIARAHVFLNDDELVIRGKAKRHGFRGFSRGHIDIAIVSDKGGLLQSLSALYYPRIIARKGGRESEFLVHIPFKPREGAVVRLAFHGVVTPFIKTFHCDDNAAIPDRHR